MYVMVCENGSPILDVSVNEPNDSPPFNDSNVAVENRKSRLFAIKTGNARKVDQSGRRKRAGSVVEKLDPDGPVLVIVKLGS